MLYLVSLDAYALKALLESVASFQLLGTRKKKTGSMRRKNPNKLAHRAEDEVNQEINLSLDTHMA